VLIPVLCWCVYSWRTRHTHSHTRFSLQKSPSAS